MGINGLVFVVSGKVETFANKDGLKKYIVEREGKLVSAISAKVDYLIIQNDDNSEKKKKANELGIAIISEQEFNKMAERRYWIEDHVLKKYIGDEEHVEIPEEVEKIENEAFSKCNSIRSVSIPEGVKEIGSWAFYGCTNLISITIPDSVEIIGKKAFDKTPWLEAQPKGVIIAGCVAIGFTGEEETLVIPDNVKSIGSFAFENCAKLREISFNKNAKIIGYSAFKGCNNLHDVLLSEGLLNIENYAFQGCQSIAEIILPEGIKTLGWGVFDNCINLSKVTVPRSMINIGLGAFSGCKKLIINTPKGSFAESYAIKNGISVETNNE